MDGAVKLLGTSSWRSLSWRGPFCVQFCISRLFCSERVFGWRDKLYGIKPVLYGDRVGKMVRSLRSVTVNMGQLEINRKTSGTSSLHHISGQRPPKYSSPIDGTYSAITLDIVTIIMLHLLCFRFFLSHPRRVLSPLPYLSPNISYKHFPQIKTAPIRISHRALYLSPTTGHPK
jgi:hypothetical protein